MSLGARSRPGGGGSESTTDVSESVRHTADQDRGRAVLRGLLHSIDLAESVRRRAVKEAIAAALAETSLRRAAMFEWARPKDGDYPGLSTPAELGEAGARRAMIAANCRAHARLLAENEAGEEDQ